MTNKKFRILVIPDIYNLLTKFDESILNVTEIYNYIICLNGAKLIEAETTDEEKKRKKENIKKLLVNTKAKKIIMTLETDELIKLYYEELKQFNKDGTKANHITNNSTLKDNTTKDGRINYLIGTTSNEIEIGNEKLLITIKKGVSLDNQLYFIYGDAFPDDKLPATFAFGYSCTPNSKSLLTSYNTVFLRTSTSINNSDTSLQILEKNVTSNISFINNPLDLLLDIDYDFYSKDKKGDKASGVYKYYYLQVFPKLANRIPFVRYYDLTRMLKA